MAVRVLSLTLLGALLTIGFVTVISLTIAGSIRDLIQDGET